MTMSETQILNSRHSRWARSGSVVSSPVVLVLIIVVIVGAVVGDLLITTLCGLVLALVFVSRLWARLAFVEVDYHCLASSGRLMEGDIIELTLTIENRKPLPLPWLSFSENIPLGLEIEGKEIDDQNPFGVNEIRATLSLGQYERVNFHHRLRAVRRGLYAFGPTRIVSSDIFGFYEARLDTPKRPLRLVVYPRTVPLPDFDLKSFRPIGDTWTRSRRAEDPTRPSGLREYQTGDSVRRIDWKATARHDAVFVRTYDPNVSQRVMILMECDTDVECWRTHPAVLEAAVIGAASVAARSIELGYVVGIVCNGSLASGLSTPVVAPGAGSDQLAAVMSTLAGVIPLTRCSLEQMVARHGPEAMPFGATLVYVAGYFRPSTVEFVTDLGRRGHRAVALYVGEGEPPVIPELQIEDYRSVFAPPESADV